MADMKADGVEYERLERIVEVTYPKRSTICWMLPSSAAKRCLGRVTFSWSRNQYCAICWRRQAISGLRATLWYRAI